MAIPLRLERTVSETEQALEWWVRLNRAEKALWLQCEETADEVDKMLQSSVLRVRELASFGAVGDAWNAFREQTLSVLDFNEVIRAGGGEPPLLLPRQRYEHNAEAWDKAGRLTDFLETGTLRLIAMRVWFYSDGCLQEYKKTRLSDTFLAYLNACLEARWKINPNWYEEELGERTNCDECGARYMLENLTICTNCLSVYCFRCVPYSPKAENGNVAHSCGGELVG